MKRYLFKLLSLYPPFLGAGIRVRVASDVKTVVVRMKMRFWNRNYVGTHYGGSLFSMCDAFFFFLLIENLGAGYIIWDRSGSIVFKKPGKGTVTATFAIPEDRYRQLKNELETGDSINPEFTVDILDEQNEVVATVTKTIYLKKKA